MTEAISDGSCTYIRPCSTKKNDTIKDASPESHVIIKVVKKLCHELGSVFHLYGLDNPLGGYIYGLELEQ